MLHSCKDAAAVPYEVESFDIHNKDYLKLQTVVQETAIFFPTKTDSSNTRS